MNKESPCRNKGIPLKFGNVALWLNISSRIKRAEVTNRPAVLAAMT